MKKATPSRASRRNARRPRARSAAKSGAQRAARLDPRPHAVVVLGMHRSGTSAVTRLISLLGADLPKNLIPANVANEAGFWESHDLMVIHDEVLLSAGSNWHDWRAFNPDWYASPAAPIFKQRVLHVLRNDYANSRLFVIKDPRICRFWPFYREVLDEFGAKPGVVIPVRNPLEVMASLRRRDRFVPAKTALLWLRHVLDAEKATRDVPRAVVTYDAVLFNWEGVVAALGATLGVSWPRRSAVSNLEIERFLVSQLPQETVPLDRLAARAEVVDWIKDAYAALVELSETPADKMSMARLDRIGAEFEKASSVFGAALMESETENAQLHADKMALQQGHTEAADEARQLRIERDALQHRFAELSDEAAGVKASFELATGELHAIKRTASWRRLEIRSNRRLIASSGLFDREWYLEKCPELRASGLDPVAHYLQCGASEGRDPNPLFDTDWYLQKYQDVGATGVNPLVHYLRHGAAAGRDPSPLFDTDWYLEQNPDVRVAGINPLTHYLLFGKAEGRRPKASVEGGAASRIDEGHSLPVMPISGPARS